MPLVVRILTWKLDSNLTTFIMVHYNRARCLWINLHVVYSSVNKLKILERVAHPCVSLELSQIKCKVYVHELEQNMYEA